MRPGVSYPRRMPDIPQLVAAIDGRLADLAAEISALDAAKAQLAAPRAGGPAAAVTRAHRDPVAASNGTSSSHAATSASRAGHGWQSDLSQSKRRGTGERRDPAAVDAPAGGTVTRPRPGGGAVGPETLERLLADTSAGLSANAIAKQAGAGYARTLKLLHELEAAGQVRRSGARRSTVWQLITDEERIAERAAELERLRSAPSRRRGRARAS